jgi:hypothetical protein
LNGNEEVVVEVSHKIMDQGLDQLAMTVNLPQTPCLKAAFKVSEL